MNVAQRRLRRLDRAMGVRTRSASSDCIVGTVSFGPDPLEVPSKAYSYEISNIEILRGTAAPVARPSNKISMDVGILLNGVCDVNGVPLLDVCEIEDAANGS